MEIEPRCDPFETLKFCNGMYLELQKLKESQFFTPFFIAKFEIFQDVVACKIRPSYNSLVFR
jgi:hypothetical protein